MIVTIEKLIHGGQALGRAEDGRIVFVWNALPGETVEIEVTKQKKDMVEGIARRVITPSPDRIEPEEKHFLSSSPWGMMSYEAELEWKKKIAIETYQRIGKIEIGNIEIVRGEGVYGYRNKIEYSFVDEGGEIFFGFFGRGTHIRKKIERSALATPALQSTADEILSWINEVQIPIRSLKSLIVRSNREGETIAALFIKDRLTFEKLPSLSSNCLGLQIFYSTHRSPASVPTELLFKKGIQTLSEEVRGATFVYDVFSFFQVNVPVFEQTLDDVAAHVVPDLPLLDFYSGVGSIGIALAGTVPHVTLVESNKDAVENAKENIEKNKLGKKVDVILSPAENIFERIVSDEQLIVDPPRAGLHPDVTARILEVAPPRVIYLSCDLSTQARDVAQLLEKYTITFSRLYNFFPRTPHIEGLVVLERKK